MPSLFEICAVAALAGIVYELAQIRDAIERRSNQGPGEDGANFEGEFMYIVKADNPDVGYALSYSVTDSEGNEVPREETAAEITSTDEEVVSIDQSAGTVHFGRPGVASVNVTVKDKDAGPDDDPLGSFGAQFTVVAGEPAAVSGGSITFEDLTEAPEEPTGGEGSKVEPGPANPEGSGESTGELPTDEGNEQPQ